MWMFTWVTIATVLCFSECGTSIMCHGRITYTRDQLLLCNTSNQEDYVPIGLHKELRQHKITKAPPTRRGCQAGQYHQRQINTIITPAACIRRAPITTKGVNHNNLVTVKTAASNIATNKLLDFCLLNPRSVNDEKKTQSVKNYLVDHKVDLGALTETWLTGTNADTKTIGDLEPTGSKLSHVPRPSRGGGVGLMHKKTLRIKPQKQKPFISFEHSEFLLTAAKIFRIVIIYRPPPSPKNKFTVSMFLEEFTSLLERLATAHGHLVMVGDFNFHINDPKDSDAKRFMDVLNTFGLTQHVSGPTHKRGHTLDLVITRSSEDVVSDIYVSAPVIADHSAIHFKLACSKPGFERKTITFRRLKSIDLKSFSQDILSSPLHSNRENTLECLVNQYQNVLSDILDKHAPLRTKVVTIRPSAQWYTPDIDDEKRKRRQLERKWKSSGLHTDQDAFLMQSYKVDEMIFVSKKTFYNSVISDNPKDQKTLFRVVDKLLHRNSQTPLPSHDSMNVLVDQFANFFVDKIAKIRESLNQSQATHRQAGPRPHVPTLSEFPAVTEEYVKKLITGGAAKSCMLDPVPTWIVKDCLDALLPIITEIINLSLSSAAVPPNLKEAIIIPLLKKILLDPEIFKNFRPVSNLRYISKLVEKVVAHYVQDHMARNNLHEILQSAYKPLHSTETALLRVQNDLLRAIDGRQATILLLLDLSAAFDTVDHDLLLDILNAYLGIDGKALAWFRSYLSGRYQSVCISGVQSERKELLCGVPQGSVLGPLLFTVYTLPLAEIIRSHGISYHFYADDTQLYLSFTPREPGAATRAKYALEACIQDVRHWMSTHMLKLNEDKTEIVYVYSKYRHHDPLGEMQIGQDSISPTDSARNIGVTFDSTLTMDRHISSVCQQGFFHLRSVSSIRHYLTPDSLKTVSHAFITSKLDHCNSLLAGLPKSATDNMQCLQNATAKMITGHRKYDELTPILTDLNWLPVKERIQFKILLLTFKCLHDLAPKYLQELISFNTRPMSLRKLDSTLLQVPRSNLKTYGERAFCSIAPVLWNSLPRHIRECTSLDSFKKNIKTHLFKQALRRRKAGQRF